MQAASSQWYGWEAEVFYKVHPGSSTILALSRMAGTHNQWERSKKKKRWRGKKKTKPTAGILIHRHSLGPPHALKMAILSNLLVLHRRFDFSQSYLTAASAPGLPSREDGGRKKRGRKRVGNDAPICNSYTLGGKCLMPLPLFTSVH